MLELDIIFTWWEHHVDVVETGPGTKQPYLCHHLSQRDPDPEPDGTSPVSVPAS